MKTRGLEEFLASLHPDESHQFIMRVLAEWAEREYRKRPQQFNKDDAITDYLQALKDALDAVLSPQTSKGFARRKQRLSVIPFREREKKKLETVALMEEMTRDEALAFLAGVTADWCFAMPSDSVRLIPVARRDETEQSVAAAFYEWVARYFDLWH